MRSSPVSTSFFITGLSLSMRPRPEHGGGGLVARAIVACQAAGPRPAVPCSIRRARSCVTGKGGVGKSTVAAALALPAARPGKRVLVCEVNTPGADRAAARRAARRVGVREVADRGIFDA